MKILLVQPPNIQRSGKWKEQNVYRTPTNLVLLASYMRNNGCEVGVMDFDVEGGSIEEISFRIMGENPQVVGFTCLTPRFPVVVDIAKRCKAINPKVIIVVGGPHVSGQPKFILKDKAIDYGVIGEGEEAFLELVDYLRDDKDPQNIANLIYRRGEEVKINNPRPFIDDLDVLPMPAWDLLNIDAYRDPAFFKGPHLGISFGRGCPWNCNFCASKVIWGRRVRLRTARNVVDELESAVNKFNINEFMFYDDTFTIDRHRVLQFCNEIRERKLNIRFYAQVRVDTIDYELANILKNAGCFTVAIGVESGDERILKSMGKGITKEQIRKCCKVLKDAKLPFLASYIIGHPGDTHNSIRATIEFANELDADQSKFLIATPYPGTKLYDLAVSKGIIKEEGADDLGDHTYFQHVAANLSCVSDRNLLDYQQSAFDEYDLRKRSII